MQPGSIYKNRYSLCCTPEGPIFFYAYCYTFTVLFLALSQSKKNVRPCMFFCCFFFFGHNGSKQGKGARKHIYINFAIFGEEHGSVLRMDEAERPQGGSPSHGGCLCTD